MAAELWDKLDLLKELLSVELIMWLLALFDSSTAAILKIFLYVTPAWVFFVFVFFKLHLMAFGVI